MDLWIPITIMAAFSQNIRSALQKHLKAKLSNTAATFVRFGFGLPFATAYLLFILLYTKSSLPSLHQTFLIWAAIGGAAQIVATACLLHIFSFRNFAVGTALSKTETVQAALFGFIMLNDQLSTGAIMGIGMSLVGVILLGKPPTLERSAIPTMIYGLASGGLFGLSAVAYRAASTSLIHESFIIQAATTLVIVLCMQTIAMLIFLIWREPEQIKRTFASWKIASLVGASGALASAGWFTAMTIQNVAYVRALGQIELLFTFIASILFFHEQTHKREVIGIILVTLGIIVLLLT